MADQRFTLDVPPVFAQDHAERDLPTGIPVDGPGKLRRYHCTEAELREWLSDANYHSDCAGYGWDFGDGAGSAYALGMQSSARATAKRAREVIAVIGRGGANG